MTTTNSLVSLKSEVARLVGFRKVETLKKHIAHLIKTGVVVWEKGRYLTAGEVAGIIQFFEGKSSVG